MCFVNKSNKRSYNNQKESFYLKEDIWVYHNSCSTNKSSDKNYKYWVNSDSHWQCNDEDLSHCHHKCKICPTGPAGPIGPIGPIGPVGPGFNSYLNGVITTDKLSLAVGDIIIYDTVNIIGPDYNYNPLTGLFTIRTAGVYVIDWKLCVSPEAGTVSIQIDLDKFPGPTFVGGISITTTSPTLNGTNLVYTAAAGDILGFVNTSSGPVSMLLVGITGPIGTISIHRIN